MTLLIVSAMESEIRGIKDRIKATFSKKISGMDFFESEFDGVKCILCVCGDGKVNAAVCVEAAALAYSPDAVLFTGVAGGIGKDLCAGDLVIADKLVQHDYDISVLGYKPGFVCNINTVFVDADSRLSDILLSAAVSSACGHKVRKGIMATGDIFVSDRKTATKIKELFGADCVDMESASVAHVCLLNNLPFAVLRAISDNGDGTAYKDFYDFLKYAVDCTADTVECFIHSIKGLF